MQKLLVVIVLVLAVVLLLPLVALIFRGSPDRPPAQAETPVLPEVDPRASEGYTLLAPIGSTETYLLDMQGRVVNQWHSDYPPGQVAYLLENGHLLRTASSGMMGNRTFHGGGTGGRVQEFSWDGELIWDFEYDSDTHLLHHDIASLPNGNVLMIAWEVKTAEEAIAAGRAREVQGDADLWCDHIIEVRPTGRTTGEIVWEWHVWDHLIQDCDDTKPNYGDVAAHPEKIHLNPIDWNAQLSSEEREQLEALGYLDASTRPTANRANPDWNHTNAVAYNPELDQIALSVLGFNEIWIIDHSTTTEEAAGSSGGRSGKGGDLLYRWGNPQAYRAGGPEDQQLFAQHDVHWIDPGLPGAGHLLIFNNGRGRSDGNYSSVDEIIPPVDDQDAYVLAGAAFGPEKAHWTYAAPEKSTFFAGHISGAQRLPNGNTLVCSGERGLIFEVTAAGEQVWEYKNPIGRGGPPGGPGMGRGPRGPGGPPDLDTNGDGLLSFEEMSVLPFIDKEQFAAYDTNSDGYLDEDERPAPGPPPGAGGPGMGRAAQGRGIGQGQGMSGGPVSPGMGRGGQGRGMGRGQGQRGRGQNAAGGPMGPGMGQGGQGRGMGRGQGQRRGQDRTGDSMGPGMGRGGQGQGRGQNRAGDSMGPMSPGGPNTGPGRQGPGGPPPGMGGPGGPGGGMNQVFRAYRYAPDYPGLAGHDLSPGDVLTAG